MYERSTATRQQYVGSVLTYFKQLGRSVPNLSTQTRTVIIVLCVVPLGYCLLESCRIWVRAKVEAFGRRGEDRCVFGEVPIIRLILSTWSRTWVSMTYVVERVINEVTDQHLDLRRRFSATRQIRSRYSTIIDMLGWISDRKVSQKESRLTSGSISSEKDIDVL